MRDAAVILEEAGVAAVDINMGCPVRKVCRVGGGATMMTDMERTAQLVRGMVEAVKIPVTAKMRLGWDDDNLTAPLLAQHLEDAGVAAVFVHGRTREQGFGGTVNLAGIRAVVEAVRQIPVIGNGDVTTIEAVAVTIGDLSLDATISIGRGAFYDPWIFQRARHFLATGETPPEPAFEDRVRVIRRHLDLMVEVFGEVLGCRMFRKVAPWYARRFGPANEFNRKVVRFSTRTEFEEILAGYREWRCQFLDETGELRAQYRPPPMVASFMVPAGTAAGDPARIAVPRGPVELW